MSHSYHLCVPVDRAIEELRKGNNIFNGTPQQALKDLIAQKKKGKPFYTGCSNENGEGKCAGHYNCDECGRRIKSLGVASHRAAHYRRRAGLTTSPMPT